MQSSIFSLILLLVPRKPHPKRNQAVVDVIWLIKAAEAEPARVRRVDSTTGGVAALRRMGIGITIGKWAPALVVVVGAMDRAQAEAVMVEGLDSDGAGLLHMVVEVEVAAVALDSEAAAVLKAKPDNPGLMELVVLILMGLGKLVTDLVAILS